MRDIVTLYLRDMSFVVLETGCEGGDRVTWDRLLNPEQPDHQALDQKNTQPVASVDQG